MPRLEPLTYLFVRPRCHLDCPGKLGLIMENEIFHYLIKSDIKIEELVKKIENMLD